MFADMNSEIELNNIIVNGAYATGGGNFLFM